MHPQPTQESFQKPCPLAAVSNSVSILVEAPTLPKGDEYPGQFLNDLTGAAQNLVWRLRKLGADPSLAEDLAQQTIIVALEKFQAREIRQLDSIKAFLYKTGYFLLVMERRQQRRRQELALSFDIGADHEPGPEMSSVAQVCFRARWIVELIQQLKESRDRDILSLHFLRELGKEPVRQMLGLSERHYDRVLFRAKSRLRKLAESSESQPQCECGRGCGCTSLPPGPAS